MNITKNDNGIIFQVCKICNKEKEINDYYFSIHNGKVYYNLECKICHNNKAKLTAKERKENPVKKIKKVKIPYVKISDRFKPELTDEMRKLLNKIDKQRGWVDEVDSYRLTSYYIDVFGYENPIEKDIKTELEFYYNSLLELM